MRQHLLLLFCFVNGLVFSQNKKASNITFLRQGDKIEIFYDLPRNKDTLDIRIYFRKKSDPKIRYRLKWVRGSVGIGKFSGKHQKAVWSYKKEPASLFSGSGFYYEIDIKKFSSKISSLAVVITN